MANNSSQAFGVGRLLAEEDGGIINSCLVNSSTAAERYDSVELCDAAKSWQGIYFSFALTVVQVIFFLVFFEVCRRRKVVGSVYDRRRLSFPDRTPLPLMRNFGLLRGFFRMEWYRFSLTDELYQRKVKAENARIKKEERKIEMDFESTIDDILWEADKKCYQESPYYDPHVELVRQNSRGENVRNSDDSRSLGKGAVESEKVEVDLSSYLMEEDDDSESKVNGDKEKEIHTVEPVSMKKLETVDSNGLDTMATTNASSQTTYSQRSDISAASPSPFTDIAGQTDSLPKQSQFAGPPQGQCSLQQSATATDSALQGKRADQTKAENNNSNASPKPRSNISNSKRVRFGDHGRSRTLQESTSGLEEIRFNCDTVPNWDQKAASAFVAFVKTKVLMLHDNEETEGHGLEDESERPEPARRSIFRVSGKSRTSEKTERLDAFITKKVFNRPLSAEDQELLRCIGLDAFMTLRFLRFGFDVSFWPFVLVMFTLIPLYSEAAADQHVRGFYSVTVVSLEDNSNVYWLLLLCGIVQFGYILRRLWIEWELFLPLRLQFLENGDFGNEKFKDQYRMTCIVEYVPRSKRHGSELCDLFDALFPGQVRRAEILLNTEHLRSLIQQRLTHIKAYEVAYAKKVHQWASYMRELETAKRGKLVNGCCRAVQSPKEPREPEVVSFHKIPMHLMHQTIYVRDPKTYPALQYHHKVILELNEEIDKEFFRLIRMQRRPQPPVQHSRIAKWLGLQYLTGSDTEQVLSSTAFVQFRSLAAKQGAIQSNLTGRSDFLTVREVPEFRGIKWENAHVSRALIDTRKAWATLALYGGLIAWSFIVSLIRSYDEVSEWVDWNVVEIAGVSAFLDSYIPAFVVEALVRLIPFVLKAICLWIRFKTDSEADLFIVNWYFGFRLITFIFVIVGKTIVDSSDQFLNDPLTYLKSLSGPVATESDFFMGYVMVAGVIQIFFRLSQLHNIMLELFFRRITNEEALPQRCLEKMRTKLKTFHVKEFIPLFIFIFMVSTLYCTLAPLAGLVVCVFYHLAYKVFRYMTLYVYGNEYESGGSLFYSMNQMIFFVLYMMIVVLTALFSLLAPKGVAVIFASLLYVTYIVQRDITRTFIEPSTMLSLSKARAFDENRKDMLGDQEKIEALRRELAALERKPLGYERAGLLEESKKRNSLIQHLSVDELKFEDDMSDATVDPLETPEVDDEEARRKMIRTISRRYLDTDELSSHGSTHSDDNDFFVYRQPALNRATWEIEPRPYRYAFGTKDVSEHVWG